MRGDSFCYEGGISQFIEYLNRHTAPLHPPIIIEGEKNDVQIEIGIQYNDTFKEKCSPLPTISTPSKVDFI